MDVIEISVPGSQSFGTAALVFVLRPVNISLTPRHDASMRHDPTLRALFVHKWSRPISYEPYAGGVQHRYDCHQANSFSIQTVFDNQA